MTNQIYIPNELTGPILSLPKDKARVLKKTIDSLGDDVIRNSSFVSNEGPAKGELREARAGNLRVLFQYTPENHSIIINDVSALTEEHAMATSV